SPAMRAFSSCEVRSCDAACGMQCGGFDSTSPTCEACYRRTCCEVDRAWAADLDAVEYRYCPSWNPARDPGRATHATGKAAVDAVHACKLPTDCAASCTEPVWSCVGHVEWPPLPSAPQDRNYLFYDYFNSTVNDALGTFNAPF